MKLSHLALTAIEDPDHRDPYHWILLEATGHEVDQLREFAASEQGYATARAAFDAGALRWRQCYDLKVNAYVVKPMDFGQLVSAIANLGVVWAVLNQPPPGAVTAQLAVA